MTLPSTAHDARPVEAPAAAVSLRGARLSFGERTLWSGLDLGRRAGRVHRRPRAERSGKSSLIRVLLGLQALSRRQVRVAGREPRRGSPHIGYIPQQKALDPDLRCGVAISSPRPRRAPAGYGLRGTGAPGDRSTRRWPRSVARLCGRTGRAAVRRRTAAAPGGPGAGRRPGRAALRRAAAVARPGPPGRRHRTDRPAAAVADTAVCSSPTRSTRSCRWSTGCSTWSAAGCGSGRRTR